MPLFLDYLPLLKWTHTVLPNDCIPNHLYIPLLASLGQQSLFLVAIILYSWHCTYGIFLVHHHQMELQDWSWKKKTLKFHNYQLINFRKMRQLSHKDCDNVSNKCFRINDHYLNIIWWFHKVILLIFWNCTENNQNNGV